MPGRGRCGRLEYLEFSQRPVVPGAARERDADEASGLRREYDVGYGLAAARCDGLAPGLAVRARLNVVAARVVAQAPAAIDLDLIEPGRFAHVHLVIVTGPLRLVGGRVAVLVRARAQRDVYVVPAIGSARCGPCARLELSLGDLCRYCRPRAYRRIYLDVGDDPRVPRLSCLHELYVPGRLRRKGESKRALRAGAVCYRGAPVRSVIGYVDLIAARIVREARTRIDQHAAEAPLRAHIDLEPLTGLLRLVRRPVLILPDERAKHIVRLVVPPAIVLRYTERRRRPAGAIERRSVQRDEAVIVVPHAIADPRQVVGL